MKTLPMTNTDRDSAGAIYATKNGSIKIIAKSDNTTAYWIKDQGRQEGRGDRAAADR